MSKQLNTKARSIDGLESSLLSPVQSPPEALMEKPAIRDLDAVALRIKSIVTSASETTDLIATRLAEVKASENPLLTAAQPLVLTLARIPDLEMDADTVPAFHALLVREIETFHQLCTQANLLREHTVAASYALCTALDEAANGTLWGGGGAATGADKPSPASAAAQSPSQTVASAYTNTSGVGVWASQMLAAYFHSDTEGGIKVFQLIGRLMTHRPEGHIDLLELLHRILSIGFQGQYRSLPDGRRQHETIRQRIYATVSQARGPVPLAISPNWRGAGPGKFRLLRSVPVWVTASVLGLGVFGLFAWYAYQLQQQTDALTTEIAAIGKMMPPPVVVAPLRLAALLKEDIAHGKVTVDEDAVHSRVVFKGDDMFIAGQAAINAKIRPLLGKVAAEIARVPGTVRVIGHSDNQPIRTARFPNNQVLSEERASVVADALQAGGVAAGRIEIRGAGESIPVGDNTTIVGRARNRRVEIEVRVAPVAASSTALAASANATAGAASVATP